MEDKISQLLAERAKFIDKKNQLLEELSNSDNDNEDTWGGHDGPQALRIENEKYLLDATIAAITTELRSLGYRDKIG